MAIPVDPFPPPIGILAGNGGFPAQIARAIRARGGDVVILGIDGEAGTDLEEFGLIRVGWGEVGRILGTFHSRGCRELVIVGGVTRPDLGRIRPDMGLVWNFPELLGIVLSGGDDGVLRALVRFVERKGLTVLSPADVAPEIVVGAGPIGHAEPSSADIADILLGSSIVKALGPFDIGQGVIVSGGRIEAIEALEGTDRMIRRVAQRRFPTGGERAHDQANATRCGVLVKRPKPSQEMRVDLPAIGPDTVARAAEAGLKGIAVLSGQTLIADRAEVERCAHAAGIFVYGFTDSAIQSPIRSRADDPWARGRPQQLTSRRASPAAIANARLGAAALARLGELGRQGAVVVRHNHVLAIDPDAARGGVYERASTHAPWGIKRWNRGIGVAVLAPDCRDDDAVASRAQDGSISGVALMRAPGSQRRDELIARLSKTKAFVISLEPDGGGA